LTPPRYFQDLLGCEATSAKLAISSPFSPKNLKVFIASGISTYYTHRKQSVDRIVTLLHRFIQSKKGNYLCFFPSYEYMAMVVDRFEEPDGNVHITVQEREMDDAGRARFLAHFSAQNNLTLVGFAVMGGIFSEGIDLVGERLSGAVIVGVGLPAITPERDLIRSYFDRWGVGFDFAYRFPGINRVLQAAGRVIRTNQDRGALLLVDQRFCRPAYQGLLPSHWTTAPVGSERQLEYRLKRFWSSGV
jgi:DNA excision repair protein ERCC-2